MDQRSGTPFRLIRLAQESLSKDHRGRHRKAPALDDAGTGLGVERGSDPIWHLPDPELTDTARGRGERVPPKSNLKALLWPTRNPVNPQLFGPAQSELFDHSDYFFLFRN